ncbi:hypothetical protein ACIBH1_12125 [Nonomuraea sp. NPDC050663]|uniref:hypothetical protein n=1 Tax=Nonomuraea sp. NPDC050663 TaxID=3364370 RepID=UPI0037B5F9C3
MSPAEGRSATETLDVALCWTGGRLAQARGRPDGAQSGIDTSIPTWRLQLHSFGVFDEFLRELIVEGVLEGPASA